MLTYNGPLILLDPLLKSNLTCFDFVLENIAFSAQCLPSNFCTQLTLDKLRWHRHFFLSHYVCIDIRGLFFLLALFVDSNVIVDILNFFATVCGASDALVSLLFMHFYILQWQ
jgi:hypothetical protein